MTNFKILQPRTPGLGICLRHEAIRLVIARRAKARRGNLAVPGRITGHSRRKRNCLPEIATAPLGPRNDNSGAFAILSTACFLRRCSAGPGCPLPYKACAFARQLVQIGSDSPRLPRPLWGLSGSQRGHKTAAEELSPAAASG